MQDKLKKPNTVQNNFNNGFFDYNEKPARNDRDSSPKRVSCPDESWQKFENQAQDEKGATNLR